MKNIFICFWFFTLPSVRAQTDSLFKLSDFYLDIPALEIRVSYYFNKLSDEEKVGQLIMPAAGKLGKKTEYVTKLIAEKKVGGILLLNGTKQEFKIFSRYFDSTSRANNGLPLLFSADAELSLINMKIKETQPVKYANKIKSLSELEGESKKICDELKYMGINYNFAPVVDLSPNETVSFRSFGMNKDTIICYSQKFIHILQTNNIAATVKHFPGHGYVTGDTHKQLVYIDGEMKEVCVYKPLIDSGVISVMVGHIAVKNNEEYNTNNMPATVSKNIVTNLLRNDMKFKGIIITDAMGMGGVASVSNNCLKAIKAGCDIVLMPKDEEAAYADILQEYKNNEEFRKQVNESVKRIIRLKICLQLL